MRPNFRFVAAGAGILFSVALLVRPADAENLIGVYLSAPNGGVSPYTGTTTETFESLSTGNRTTDFVSTIGTYDLSNTSKFNINSDNQYGSGTGKFMAFGAQSGTSAPITLTFTAPQAYFGFSWNAGDRNNGLTFYNGDTIIGRFSTASILNVLSAPTVTALDGTVYQSTSYYGKPGSGQNSGEPYAFLNFIDTKGLFTKVVFDNSGTTGTGFESDNHTIRATAPTPQGSFVYVGGPSVPEPGSLLLLGIAAPFVGLLRRKKG